MAYTLLLGGTVIASDSDNVIVNMPSGSNLIAVDLKDIVDAYNLYRSIRDAITSAEALRNKLRATTGPVVSA